MAPNSTASARKLEQLRDELNKADVAAFIVPSSDPHLLEYAPPQFMRRAYITGFTGSAGTAVITAEGAALWTDARYFIQAENQLSGDWTLMRMGMPNCPSIREWLSSSLPSGAKVGIDAFLHAESEARSLKTDLQVNSMNKRAFVYRSLELLQAKDIELEGLVSNPVDVVWGEERPKDQMKALFVHPVDLAGETAESKLQRIRAEMEKVGASIHLVAKVEEIAWTLNLRGADEDYSPIFIAYLLITADAAELFVAEEKVTPDVRSYLQQLGVTARPYDQTMDAVKAGLEGDADSKIWLDPRLVNHAIFLSAQEALVADQVTHPSIDAVDSGVPAQGRLISKSTPWTLFMAVKNKQELEGMREAHQRDGTAVVEFLSWFEQQISSGRVFTEVEVHEEISARRSVQKGFRSLSFPTIAGANGNGAIIHYSASAENCAEVDSETMLLIDSGGQYDCGTTDVTRTFHLGTPSDYQRTCFTKVLQGHIALATSVFPEDTAGIALDAFARRPLWSLGLQYLHGTGHGIGAYMCVHEGPISVSFRQTSSMAQEPLKENMIISNEPGYYENGKFGIRIENICVVRPQPTPFSFNDISFYGFDTITVIPIQKKLMKKEEMSPEEIAWVNGYHQEVWEKISDRLSPSAKEWLKESTAPL